MRIINKIEYPPAVKNKKAYRELLEYCNHPYFTDEDVRIYHTSDPNIKLDLQATTSVIKKKIGHLPENEKEDILIKNKAAMSIKSKMMNLKQIAYGKNNANGYHEFSKSILDAIRAELITYFSRLFPVKRIHRFNLWN